MSMHVTGGSIDNHHSSDNRLLGGRDETVGGHIHGKPDYDGVVGGNIQQKCRCIKSIINACKQTNGKVQNFQKFSK